MTTVAIQEKYVDTLTAFGELQETIDKALQRYTVEKITDKISELRQKDHAYCAKYDMDYPDFAQRITHDEAFITHIEGHITKMWEVDLADWEFCYKGIKDWTQKLHTILLT